MEQPNLIYGVRNILGLEPDLPGTFPDQCGLWVLYGEPSYTEQNHLYGHKWGWTPAALIGEALSAGFNHAEENYAKYHYPQRDFRIEATK